jgi:DNA-binding MarR family transcriptional regulator
MQDSSAFVGTLRELIGIAMRRSMGSFLVDARESGLSMSQIGALIRIRNQNMLGISEIGDELRITNAAASQLIDRLVQQDLISRSENPQDRRVKHIELTEKGHQMIHAGMHSRLRWLEDLSTLLTPAEQEQVTASMRLLIERARQLEQPKEKV